MKYFDNIKEAAESYKKEVYAKAREIYPETPIIIDSYNNGYLDSIESYVENAFITGATYRPDYGNIQFDERNYVLDQLAVINDIGELSDGYHTFNSLYNQRLYLFAALVKAYKERAWKTRLHEDGKPCFDGNWFLVGIDTPEGSYTYHFENEHWDLFDCVEIEHAKPFDGHTDADVGRLMSL